MPLENFSAPVRAWFETNFGAPTDAQGQSWPAIARGDNALVVAPTGSGKTLAAFLWSIDHLGRLPDPPATPEGRRSRCRVLYISPLRALAVDVDKNLRAPLRGIELAAERLGASFRVPTVALRTGDTDAKQRAALARTPPDILITTPESLYLMLTSQAREILRSVETVIIDEIHALVPTKRGAHLALSLERLDAITDRPVQRIGLSATVRPVDGVARFLGGHDATGPRRVHVVDAGARKELDLQVIVPVDDLAAPAGVGAAGPGGSAEERTSIWPHIHPRLLELIAAHRTTIVFTNARRLAERLAARLNELAGSEIVRAHHGSLAREQRRQVEDDLKAGRLRAIVATSSLELGIDMGTVDLVVLVESPGSVARGLQRVGRAGHQVGAPSTGRIFPKWRGDLLETAAVAERMRDGLVEEMHPVENALDVLAQHIVAACVMDEWSVNDLRALVRRAAGYHDLSDDLFDAVLDLLAGRYPSDRFTGLRPRIVWNRIDGIVRAHEGAQRVAVTNGGTIPDRGLFGVFLPDGARVGELDEEMVYESRPGEVFALGASSWRIEEITHERVVVTPAPGEPAKMPFWKGDKPGRPLELGRAIGRLTRDLRTLDDTAAADHLRAIGFDDRAASNLVRYLAEQADATSAVPDDRTIVVERFPDEIGDWRVCILTPFGARVHAPWALAIEAAMADAGLDVPAMWSDDGIVLRLPEAIDRLPDDALLPDPDTIDDLVVDRLPHTSLFAARFRENAARALLLPRRDPTRRTPLWMQRQRAADLLEVAADHADFPILLETTRECVRDVFDLPALHEVLADIRRRRVRVVHSETRRASPFAQSLLFGWIAVYMYEGDAPVAERRAAALALDRGLLRDLLGAEELRDLLDPVALARLELELQRLVPERHARSEDGVVDLLRELGDLRHDELAARVTPDLAARLDDIVATLVADRRVITLQVAGESRLVAADDAARFRDALGCALPVGLPAVFTDPVDRPLDGLVARFARTHGPFTVEECSRRLAANDTAVRDALGRLASEGRVVFGEFRPGGTEREWCDDGVLRSVRRRSLAALRAEVEPADPRAFARFLPEWQGVASSHRGLDALVAALEQLQGVAIPASVLERSVLPARVPDYQPRMLDDLCAAGELVWVGAGALGDDGRVRIYFRDRVRLLGARVAPSDLDSTPLHDTLRTRLASGAAFWSDLVAAVLDQSGATRPVAASAGPGLDADILRALWDLVWAGEVTNDTFAPLRAARPSAKPSARTARRRPNVGRLTRLGPPAAAGRWSLVAPLLEPSAEPTEVALAVAQSLLDRHGIVTREGVHAESVPGGFAGIYPLLRTLEDRGTVRRGWFVAGLGAAQFAAPGAVDRLRAQRDTRQDTAPLVLSAVDPAQPYGAALAWPDHGGGRTARVAGAFTVLHDGALRVFVEQGGRSLLVFPEPEHSDDAWATALADAVTRGVVPPLELRTIDGGPARDSTYAALLRSVGFADGYRGLVLRNPTGRG